MTVDTIYSFIKANADFFIANIVVLKLEHYRTQIFHAVYKCHNAAVPQCYGAAVLQYCTAILLQCTLLRCV